MRQPCEARAGSPAPPPGRFVPRRAIILIAVLVVVVILSLVAYQYSDLMASEHRAADTAMRTAQVRLFADSGVHYAAAVLSTPDNINGVLNGNPFDNPGAFQGQVVQANGQPRLQGRFSIVAPVDPADPTAGSQPFRFGVLDEAAKVNLNALLRIDPSGKTAHDILMKLPNMTEDVANAILDWIDPDDTPRENGAEGETYGALSPAYRPKNGPLDSLDELLLVRGVTVG